MRETASSILNELVRLKLIKEEIKKFDRNKDRTCPTPSEVGSYINTLRIEYEACKEKAWKRAKRWVKQHKKKKKNK